MSSSVCACLSVSFCLSLFPSCLSSLSSLLGSQLALFLWPFDLSERVWSFKVLLFPLSGAPLFLLSGLGFQRAVAALCCGWVGQVVGGGAGGWADGRVRRGFYEVVRLR